MFQKAMWFKENNNKKKEKTTATFKSESETEKVY